MSNATQAGVPIEVDGVQYVFSPITFEDIEYLEMWAKAQAIIAGRMSVPVGTDQAEYNRQMQPILERADKINLFDNGLDAIMTASGIVQLLHRMLMHKHPDVTLAQIKGWCSKKSLLESILAIVQLLFPQSAGKRGAPLKRRVPTKRRTTGRK